MKSGNDSAINFLKYKILKYTGLRGIVTKLRLMKRKIADRAGAMLLAMMLLGSCGSKGEGGNGAYPAGFDTKGDVYRVSYIMEHAEPDSVARFICGAALGQVPGARIDTLATATLYVYENYRDSDAQRFGDEYDRVVSEMSLDNKMKMYMMGGSEDPQKLGYKLGLEYMSHIRENHIKPEQVEKELAAFRKACGSDTATYRRFLIGFKTVLKADRGKDVSEEIYNRFINY